jgi:hypothetical protein
VAVPVMQVGVMRMGVMQRRMAVPMRMRLIDRTVMHVPIVRVLVVLVMAMAVLVLERLVPMLVVVPFGEMHP